MDIGIGLPAAVEGADGDDIVEWARAAEGAGFSSLGAVDRLAYPNIEPLVALSAAAAVTRTVRLVTSVLLGPLRNTAGLAKQAASLDRLSGGRLTLGLAVGSRKPDYEAAAVDFGRRGRILDAQIDEMTAIWAEARKGTADGIGPAPIGLEPDALLVGGASEAALRRVVRLGCGWVYGGPDAAGLAPLAARLTELWTEGGRAGRPRIVAFSFFGLGPSAAADAARYIRAYYAYAPFMESLLAAIPADDQAVGERIAAFTAAGCDELLLFPCGTDVAQVGRLAEVVHPLS